MQWIGELCALGLTVTEIREPTTAWQTGDGQLIGRRMAQLLDRSHERLTQRIAAQQQTLRRIEAFEAAHQADLADGDFCWAGDPRCPTRA